MKTLNVSSFRWPNSSFFNPTTAAGFSRKQNGGQTFAEVLVAIGVLGFMLVSLYAGFSSGFAVVRVARENLRATQILEERMEVIRLFRWEEVAPGFIPTNFTAPFYADSSSNSSGNFVYTGKVTIAKAPITESYADDLRMVQIDLNWKSGKITRSRQMTTFVSQHGLQQYIY